MAAETEPTIQSLAEGQQQLTEGQQQITSLLANFIAEQRQFNERTDHRLETIQADVGEQRELYQQLYMLYQAQRNINGEIERRIKRIEDNLLEQRQFNDEQRQFNDEQRRFNAEQRQFNERTEARLRIMHDDIAEVKGGHARVETLRRAGAIAAALNFLYERTLSPSELDDMVRENPGIGVAANELQSFAKAGLVIKGKDSSLLTNYIAVEISYTADQRDIDRAIRNADLLSRFTGRPAHPVIASVRNDSVVSNLVADGFIRWYEIPQRDLQAA